MDSVASRPLWECKLRRCIYLGTSYSIYVPSSYQEQFWGKDNLTHRFDFNIVKVIGNIVKKKNHGQINSIVPLLLKINRENPLHGEKRLIFALAVCARFNLIQCSRMVRDAYAAVRALCSDGSRLLMFVRYCHLAAKMLYEHGFLPQLSSGLTGSGFRKALQKWYLDRDAFETTKMIMMSKRFETITHKRVMQMISICSDDPLHRIMIMYTTQSMEHVREYYRARMRGYKRHSPNSSEMLTLSLLNGLFRFLDEYSKSHTSMETRTYIKFVQRNMIGKFYDVLPSDRQCDLRFLPSYVEHMPLRLLLSKVSSLAKQGFFYNLKGHEDCLIFINRFNHHFALKKSQIHPIESYVEYLKYANSGTSIARIRKTAILEWNPADSDLNKSVIDQSALKENNCVELIQTIDSNNDNKEVKSDPIIAWKPIPKYSEPLQKLLSDDLVTKTLKNLKMSKSRMLIAYDGRSYMASRYCRFPHLKVVKMFDAITIAILSLIYPERELEHKPTIVRLCDSKIRFKQIHLDFKQSLTFDKLKETLFKKLQIQETSHNKNKDVQQVYPLAAMNWARKREKRYDVFVFFGTNKTDFRHIKNIKEKYGKFLGQKRVKTIFCCLSGKHHDQINLSREGMLFIPGFDKHIGQIMQSFIHDEF